MNATVLPPVTSSLHRWLPPLLLLPGYACCWASVAVGMLMYSSSDDSGLLMALQVLLGWMGALMLLAAGWLSIRQAQRAGWRWWQVAVSALSLPGVLMLVLQLTIVLDWLMAG